MKNLFDEVSSIVTSPVVRAETFSDNSFILHAPLELCTRYFLFPLVYDEHREEAILRIEAIAQRYKTFTPDLPDTRERIPLDDDHFAPWATSLELAAHAPILRILATKIGETNESIDDILSVMNAVVVSENSERMSWVNTTYTGEINHIESGSLIEWMISHIANPVRTSENADSIMGVVRAGEYAGAVEPVVAALRETAFDPFDLVQKIFPVLMRISALSMLIESEEQSKYGWTHALTIPHSHWLMAHEPGSMHTVFCAAASFVASYRSVYGETSITGSDFSQYYDENEESVFASHHEEMRSIISRASICEDAHLIKYVYSCFDCMKRDPQYTQLYIAAAQRLLAVWS